MEIFKWGLSDHKKYNLLKINGMKTFLVNLFKFLFDLNLVEITVSIFSIIYNIHPLLWILEFITYFGV